MVIGIDASRAFDAQRTGTEEYSYQIIKHLLDLPEASNHTWILYTKREVDEDWLKRPNVCVQPIGLPRLWTQLGLSVATWTRNLDTLWVPAHTLPVLRRPGIKTVVTVHGIEYEYLPAYENALQRWYLPLSTQYAVKSADHVIAVSDFTKSQLVERLHANSKKITVIHEGVALKRLKITKEDTTAILKRFQVTPKKYVVFIGTIQPRKNIKRLIEAFTDMSIDGYDLLLIGKMGWGNDDLPMNTEHVRFIGYMIDIEKNILLKSAALYVQPSITEGFGLPILEAFDAEVPVVSSNGGALPEVVGDAGVLFDPLNVSEMSVAMAKVIENLELQNKLIESGKNRLAEFSWEKAAKETYKVLTHI